MINYVLPTNTAPNYAYFLQKLPVWSILYLLSDLKSEQCTVQPMHVVPMYTASTVYVHGLLTCLHNNYYSFCF